MIIDQRHIATVPTSELGLWLNVFQPFETTTLGADKTSTSGPEHIRCQVPNHRTIIVGNNISTLYATRLFFSRLRIIWFGWSD